MSKKIVFIINKPSMGGAELFLLKLARYMSQYCECYIIFLNPAGEILEQFKSTSGCTIHCLSFSRNPVACIKSFIELRRLLKSIRPEVVHTWLYISDFIGGIAAYTCRIPKICWSIRQSNISFSQNGIHTFFLARLCGAMSWIIPDKIISCSEVAAEVHVRKALYSQSKILVIPNGYKTAELVFSDAARQLFREEIKCEAAAKVVGIIGRFDIQKGFDNFINIAKNILANRQNVLFVFVGPGCVPENLELASMMEILPDANVRLLGRRTDIKNILCGLDVLIIPSRGEAFPNVLGEAMCIGVPVVTTDVGEMPIILKDLQECYPPGANHEMASAVLDLLNLDQWETEQVSARLRRRIIERYDLTKVLGAFRDAYLS